MTQRGFFTPLQRGKYQFIYFYNMANAMQYGLVFTLWLANQQYDPKISTCIMCQQLLFFYTFYYLYVFFLLLWFCMGQGVCMQGSKVLLKGCNVKGCLPSLRTCNMLWIVWSLASLSKFILYFLSWSIDKMLWRHYFSHFAFANGLICSVIPV